MKIKKRLVHMARRIRADGAVSAVCSPTPRAINLRVATWTLIDSDVTCARCIAILASPCAAIKGDT